MEINITWNICRVCLVEEEKKPQVAGAEESMRHIFNEDKQLAKQIYECSGISMKPNDNLPEKICKKCLTLVKYAVNFRKTCRSSDTYLQTILQRTKSASILFKPERPPSVDFEDDNIVNEAIIDENNEDGIATEDEAEQSQTLKRQGTPLEKSPKKIRNDTNSPEIHSNTDELIAHDDEEEIADNDLNNMVEIEEVLEHSEPSDDKSFTAAKHDNSLDKNIDEQQENEVSDSHDEKSKSSQIQDFQINEVTAEEDDYLDDNTQETAIHDIKQNSGEFYYLKDIRNENMLHEQNLEDDDHIETDDQEDENVEFIPVEEEGEEEDVDRQQLMLDCESDMEDNQAQVSSTVVTKEEAEGLQSYIELQEQDSNLSNATTDLQTEYIVDEYLIDDSNSNISSRNSSVLVVNSKKQKKAKRVSKGSTKNVDHSKASASSSTSSVGGSQQQVWVCDLCGNNFSTRQLINAHMKVHRQEKNHECELCFKRFITSCNLQAHMRMHTGEKPFECQYCGRRFSDRSTNLRHERIHTNEKPFHCTICDKAFSLATTLKKHMKVHTGERSYRCEPCAKSFKLPHQLKAHKNTTLHKAVEQLGLLAN